MKALSFFISLRNDLLEIVTGVKDSSFGIDWDDTTPNWVTKNNLEKVTSEYFSKAYAFGMIKVTLFGDCRNSKHGDLYYPANEHDEEMVYKDPNYCWDTGSLYLTHEYCVCPCSNDNNTEMHSINIITVYTTEADVDFCNRLNSIFSNIYDAIECADHKRPRSSIRESLLTAILKINDEILPASMDDYVKKLLR